MTLAETGSGKTFTMTPADDSKGNLVLLLVDDTNGKTFVGTQDELKEVPKVDVHRRQRIDHEGERLRGA